MNARWMLEDRSGKDSSPRMKQQKRPRICLLYSAKEIKKLLRAGGFGSSNHGWLSTFPVDGSKDMARTLKIK